MDIWHYPNRTRHLVISYLVAFGTLCSWGTCGTNYQTEDEEDPVDTARLALLSANEEQYFSATSPGVMAGALFGDTLSMSGDGTMALIGHPANGSVELYKHAPLGWVQEASFIARPLKVRSTYRSVGAISRNGTTLIIGSRYPTGESGWVEIYEYRASGGGPATWLRTAQLTLSESGARTNYFGYAVAISANGDVAAISNPGWNAGSPGELRLYQRAEKDGMVSWMPATALKAPHYLSQIGSSIALSDDGRTVAVNATYTTSPAERPRASAYLCELSEDLSRLHEYHLVPLDAVAGDNEDTVVALSADGTAVVLGSPSHEHPGVDGIRTGQGAAYVFERSLTFPDWRQTAQLFSSDLEFDHFAAAVAMSGDGQRLLIGAPSEGDGTQHYGAAYLFAREAGVWREQTKIRTSNKVDGASFGAAVAMDTAGQRAMAAAPSWLGTGQIFGYVFRPARPNGSPCVSNDECFSRFCVDRVCCNEACGGGDESDCQVCIKGKGAKRNGQCALRSATAVCRPARGICDVAELCTGTARACPMDARAPRTKVCRPATDLCDLDDFCDGTSVACPSKDTKRAKGDVCRKAAGPCDAEEVCNGSSTACPADIKLPAETVCRGLAGVCDVEEKCTGNDDACPGDRFAPATMICRPSSVTCLESAACTGKAANCPANPPKPVGTTCGGGTDPICDPGNTCDGVGMCIDRRAMNGTICKLSSGADGICMEKICVR